MNIIIIYLYFLPLYVSYYTVRTTLYIYIYIYIFIYIYNILHVIQSGIIFHIIRYYSKACIYIVII